MDYRSLLYVFFTGLSAFALSGVNFDNIMHKNKVIEARVLVVVLSIIGGYLLTNFVLEFVSLTQLI